MTWETNHPDFGKEVDTIKAVLHYENNKSKIFDNETGMTIDILSPAAINFIKDGQEFKGKIIHKFIACEGCKKICLDCRMNPGKENIDESIVLAINTYH